MKRQFSEKNDERSFGGTFKTNKVFGYTKIERSEERMERSMEIEI